MTQVNEVLSALQKKWELNVLQSFETERSNRFKKILHLNELHREFLSDSVFLKKSITKRNTVFNQLKAGIEELIQDAKGNTFAEQVVRKWADYLQTLDTEIEEVQPEERFQKQAEDNFFVGIGKAAKRLDRSVSRVSNSSVNAIRRVFKANEVQLEPKKQHIPFQLICYNFTHPELIEWLTLFTSETNSLISESVRLIHQNVNSQNLEKEEVLPAKQKELLSELEAFITEIESQSNSFGSVLTEKTQVLFKAVKHDLARAGTFENPITEQHTNAGKRAEQNYFAEYEKRVKSWIKEWNAQRDYILQIQELESVNQSVLKKFNKLISDFDSRLTEHYPNVWKDFASQIEVLNKRIESHTSGKSNQKFLNELSNGVKASTNLLKNKIFPTLESDYVLSLFDADIEAYDQFFDEQIEKLSAKAVVITELEKDVYPPKIVTKSIQWQSLINRIMIDDHVRYVPDISQKIAAYLLQAGETLRSIDEIIEVNLIASHDSLQKKADSDSEAESAELSMDNAIETASSALERVSMLMAQVISEFEEQTSSLWKQYSEQLNEVISYLESKLHGNELADLEYRRRELQVRSTALDFKTRAQIIWAKTEDVLILYGRFGSRKIKEYYAWVRNLLFPESVQTKRASQLLLGEYLNALRTKLDSLPFIYRKLFSLQQNTDLRHFTGYEQELAQFKQTFQAWKQDLIRTTLIIGETGSGKSLVINKALEKLEHTLPVVRISIKKTITSESDLLQLFIQQLGIHAENFEELTKQLNLGPKRILVFDSIDKSYLRVVSGFKALNELLLLINETAKQVFWVVSIGRYAWHYLDKVNQLSKFFTDEIYTDQLKPMDIKDLLIKRHRSSGFQLRFEPDAEIRQLRAYKKVMGNEDERQLFLERLFFEKLYEVSLGNSKIAIIQWLRSIQEFNTFEMIVLVESDLQIELPHEIDRTEFFALAFILQHESLSVAELAKAFHQSEKQTSMLLSRMEMMNLIEEKDGVYTVNIFAYRPVVKALTKRNILYS
ncbi:hypothetical protein EP331_15940 [bacterium]|nr:MAG: hypothetical protein EP331_15940 [bacterium]